MIEKGCGGKRKGFAMDDVVRRGRNGGLGCKERFCFLTDFYEGL